MAANWWEQDEVVETGPKAAPAWGPGAVELPDGSVVRYGPRGGTTILKKSSAAAPGSVPDLTQDQGQAQTYGRLMSQAERSYQRALSEGYDPGSFRNATASVLEGLPFGGLDGLGTLVRDPVGDRARQAELQWSDAQLKAMSGAAAPEPEVKRNVKTFFPRPGENVRDISQQKTLARREGFEGARLRAGPAGPLLQDYPVDRTGQLEGWSGKLPPAQLKAARLFEGSKGKGGSRSNPFIPRSVEEFKSYPKGAYFIDDDGTIMVKK